MNLRVIARNIDKSRTTSSTPRISGPHSDPEVAGLIQKKLESVERVLPERTRVHAYLETNRSVDCVEVCVFTQKSCFKASARGETLTECLDQIEKKLLAQILKKKERLEDRRFRKPLAHAV